MFLCALSELQNPFILVSSS